MPSVQVLSKMYDTAPTTNEWPTNGYSVYSKVSLAYALCRFVVTVVGLHPKSRGSVLLQSKDPTTPVRINPNYLSDADDSTVLLEVLYTLSEYYADTIQGVKMARHILGTKAFSELFSNEVVFTDIPYP